MSGKSFFLLFCFGFPFLASKFYRDDTEERRAREGTANEEGEWFDGFLIYPDFRRKYAFGFGSISRLGWERKKKRRGSSDVCTRV